MLELSVYFQLKQGISVLAEIRKNSIWKADFQSGQFVFNTNIFSFPFFNYLKAYGHITLKGPS